MKYIWGSIYIYIYMYSTYECCLANKYNDYNENIFTVCHGINNNNTIHTSRSHTLDFII